MDLGEEMAAMAAAERRTIEVRNDALARIAPALERIADCLEFFRQKEGY